MAVKIVTKCKPDTPKGVGQYWQRLRHSVGKLGLDIEWVMLDRWTRDKPANPNTDLIVVDNQDALAIPREYAVIAVQHGCAMEHGLRAGTMAHVEMGRAQWLAGQRPRTFWVGCSAWAAYHCKRHMGVQAQKIILAAVDVNAFYPGERQVKRDAKKPVVLHHCKDTNKGSGVIALVAKELKDSFDVRMLDCAPKDVPNAMRDADIWLSLGASEGGPTVVQEALASNLIVVGTNTGLLWSYYEGTPLHAREKGAVAWMNTEIGAVVFDWQWGQHKPEYIADWVRAAWKHGKKLNGQDYALRWYSYEQFAQKWLEAIEAAMRQFDLEPEQNKVADGARPPTNVAPLPPKVQAERGVR